MGFKEHFFFPSTKEEIRVSTQTFVSLGFC